MGLNIEFIIIYFIYGLAFFVLGIASFLESDRSPKLAEARVLRPLAVFGLIHGSHEWLEMIFIFSALMGRPGNIYFVYLRLVMLIVSFISLIAFGVQVFRTQGKKDFNDVYVGLGMLFIYMVAVFVVGAIPKLNPEWSVVTDLLARWILAIPGAVYAAFALRKQAKQAEADGRKGVSSSLMLASIGFFVYGISQFFGPKANILFADVINGKAFSDFAGFPIQVIRAGIAIVITFAIIRSTQIIGRERQNQLLAAQHDRVEALERVQEEMKMRIKMRKELLQRTVLLQEEERIRISRELHDETAQYLTAFSANLAALENRLMEDEKNIELFERLHNLSDQMSQKLSRLVHDLRPAQLDELGLTPALSFLIDRLNNDLGLKAKLKINGEYSKQNPYIETVLFRVAQEGLINISRHAETKNAQVILSLKDDHLELVIKDDGKGFSVVEDHWPDDSFGLIGMRERVESVQGNIEIDSEIGKGTQVVVNIPLE